MQLAGHGSRRFQVIALTWLCVGGFALSIEQRGVRFLHHGHHGHVLNSGKGHNLVRESEHGSELMAVQVDAAMEAVVTNLLERKHHKPVGHKEMTKLGVNKVNVKAALQRLQGRLPADVASLVHSSVEHSSSANASQPSFSEDSLAKGRKVLNDLIEKGWAELDAKVVKCKEFEEKNRGTWSQVMTDLARLAENIVDLQKLKAEATENINVKEQEITDVTAKLKKETDIYNKIHAENKAELTIRQNDMAVFQFMMEVTKCPSKTSFAQLDKHDDDGTTASLRVCDTEQGMQLRFDDKKIQAEMERKMTPSALQAIREVIELTQASEAKAAAAQLQREARADDDYDSEDGSAQQRAAFLSLGVDVQSDAPRVATRETEQSPGATTAGRAALLSLGAPAPNTTTTTTKPFVPYKVSKTITRVPPEAAKLKCTKGPPDCGLLNDKMSLLWGQYKDLVDELQQTMEKNAFEFSELKDNFNAQLQVLRNAKARFITELNEAVANLNSLQEEKVKKEAERQTLDHEFKAYMAACKARVEWILYQDICSYLSVRASVMAFSKVSPPEKITDCDVTDWVPAECSVSCDDECPDPNDPYGCGGWQKLDREVRVSPNEFGYKCPPLTRKKKCNQIKCPVDCVQSQWSGYSKCSKECEGGVKSRTRTILTQPANGGLSCNTVQESEPCNSGSCDRNCKLGRWSKWTPCSVACSGGYQERFKRVIRPIRGNGKCPKAESTYRYGKMKCNTHDCIGDEICIAVQDLVLAVDGSGSFTESGFRVLKDFAGKLVAKYQGTYFGKDDMHIGVVQFGNGHIMPDGTVAKALEVLQLTKDMDAVAKAVAGMKFLKGFTNMAQAFTAAEKLLLLGGRKNAQSAVLTLTDGKPSFLFQTNEKVMQLKDKHVKLFFAPIVQYDGKELTLMKKWASQPWGTHIVHVPGLDALEADPAIFAQKMIVKFCPRSMSPSTESQQEKAMGHFIVRENGQCGAKGAILSTSAQYADDCAALAKGAGVQAFLLGVRFARGRCIALDMKVTKELVQQIQKDRANPPCPAGSWSYSGLYDTYAIAPL